MELGVLFSIGILLLVTFPVIVLAIAWIASRTLLHISISTGHLGRGEAINVSGKVSGGFCSLSEFGIVAEEILVTGSGKSRRLRREKIHEQKGQAANLQADGSFSSDFAIPASAPPSIGPYSGKFVRSARLAWKAYVKGKLFFLPIKREVEFKVA